MTRTLPDFQDAAYAGHFGIQKTCNNVRRYFWWPNTFDFEFGAEEVLENQVYTSKVGKERWGV